MVCRVGVKRRNMKYGAKEVRVVLQYYITAH